MSESKKMPLATTAVFIFNKKGELFLMHSPKWQGKLTPPGGKIDYGEKVIDCAAREVEEETGLKVKNLELIAAADLIDSEVYSRGKCHFVGLEYRADLVGSDKAKLDKKEGSDYVWLKPEEILKRDDVEECTRGVIEKFILNKDKKKLFKTKKCKNCEKVENEMQEYKAGWQRAQADYKNLQKETEDKRQEWLEYSKEQILNDFIPVYDNFKKAFSADITNENEDPDQGYETGDTNKKWKNWSQGIGFIMKQYADVLKQYGVEEIKTVGEKFDHEKHEAVGEEESEEESGIILKEVEGGYKMGEKVVRVAKVIVSK